MEKIDLNSACYEDLVHLPQIGAVLATRLLRYRSEHGRITNISELRNCGFRRHAIAQLELIAKVAPN